MNRTRSFCNSEPGLQAPLPAAMLSSTNPGMGTETAPPLTTPPPLALRPTSRSTIAAVTGPEMVPACCPSELGDSYTQTGQFPPKPLGHNFVLTLGGGKLQRHTGSCHVIIVLVFIIGPTYQRRVPVCQKHPIPVPAEVELHCPRGAQCLFHCFHWDESSRIGG